MKKTIKLLLVFLITTLIVSVLAACGANNNDEAKNNESEQNNDTAQVEGEAEGENDKDEVVTIKLFFPWGQELFDERVGPIDERLENINIELLEHGEGSTEGLVGAIEQFSAENIVPDIIVMGSNELTDDYMSSIIQPLDDLVEKHDFDLGIINPAIIDSIRATSKDGDLLSIPNSNDTNVLYYNKDVFDKFGVEYPSDDLTWEDAIELAKKLSGERDGIEYRGLDIRGAERHPLEQRSVNLTDPETGEVLLAKEPAVKLWLELAEDIYSIPGNLPPEDSDALGDFISGNVAMALSSPQFLRWGIPAEKAGDVDFAAAPVWSDLPEQSAPAMSHYHWVINQYSEHQDEAFQVLVEYLSEETQLQLTRGGQEMTVLAEDDIKLQFGADLENYEGKNIAGIFAHEPATPPEQRSKWDKYVKLDLFKFIDSNTDTNTFLREMTEETETGIIEAEN